MIFTDNNNGTVAEEKESVIPCRSTRSRNQRKNDIEIIINDIINDIIDDIHMARMARMGTPLQIYISRQILLKIKSSQKYLSLINPMTNDQMICGCKIHEVLNEDNDFIFQVVPTGKISDWKIRWSFLG